MKRIISVLSAIVMMFSLVAMTACSSGTSDNGDVSGDNTEKKTKLVMATSAHFPPYEYYDGETIVGIDAEIAAKIAEKLGMELEISDMAFSSILAAVQTGKVDFGMAGMTVTEDRLKSVDFSDSYATGIQAVIVKEDSDIKTIDDLKGKKIGVQLSTTGDIYASDTPENGGFGEENIDKYTLGNDAVLALVQGKVDAVIIDNEPAKEFVKSNEGLKILDTEYVVEDYAIAFSKENTELRDKVNTALDELIADGTVKSIIDKYINAG